MWNFVFKTAERSLLSLKVFIFWSFYLGSQLTHMAVFWFFNFFLAMRNFRIYSLSSFQTYNRVLLPTVSTPIHHIPRTSLTTLLFWKGLLKMICGLNLGVFFWSPPSACVPNCMAVWGSSTQSEVIFSSGTRCFQNRGSFLDLREGVPDFSRTQEAALCRCFMLALFTTPSS